MSTLLRTASGRVQINPVTEPDDAGAVLYEVTGAVKGTVHVCGTHNVHEWDTFDTVRVSLGSTSATREEAPEESLPRVRGRAYTGSLLHVPHLPDDVWETWRFSASGLRTMDDRDAPPQTAHSLTAVMRACASHYAARMDLSHLMDAARAHETPALLRFFEWAIPASESDARRADRKADQGRRDAHTVVAAWWQAARMFQRCPSLPLAVLLAPYRGSFAHQADYLPHWVKIYADSAASERRRVAHFRSEYRSLSAHQSRKTAGRKRVTTA